MPRSSRSALRLQGGALPVVLVLLAAAGPARAEPPLPPPAADPRLYAPPSVHEEAGGFACSVQTLVSGAGCILESEASASTDRVAQARDNEAQAASLAGVACAAAAQAPGERAADRDLTARCERVFKERAQGCGADGARALLDGRGLFAPEARNCYAALAEVLASARTAASVAVPCCRCLAAAHCLDADRCQRDLVSGPVSSKTAACIQASCGDACRTFRPNPPPAAVEPLKPAAAQPAPPWCREPFFLENRCDRI